MKILHLIDTNVLLNMRIKDRFYKMPENPSYEQQLKLFLNVNGFPTDGIFQAMKKFTALLKEYAGNHNTIVWFFDRKSKRKKIYKQYKGNRKPKFDVYAQANALENWLTLSNFNVIFRDEYEADDLIASVYLKYYNAYDKIIIHTVDSDLAYLVDEKCFIDNPNPKFEDITLENYSQKICKGHTIPYNTSILWKIFFGDNDNIPNTYILRPEAFTSMINYIIDTYKYTGKTHINEQFIDWVIDNVVKTNTVSKDQLAQLKTNRELVYPMLVNDVEIHTEPVNTVHLTDFLNRFKMKSVAASLNLPYKYEDSMAEYTRNLLNKLIADRNAYYEKQGLLSVLEVSTTVVANEDKNMNENVLADVSFE